MHSSYRDCTLYCLSLPSRLLHRGQSLPCAGWILESKASAEGPRLASPLGIATIGISGYSLLFCVLSTLRPSSVCSATSSEGMVAGIIRRGLEPGTRAYLLKSVTPRSRRRSSSSTVRPVTSLGDALMISKIASEKISGFRSSARRVSASCVAADSIAYGRC